MYQNEQTVKIASKLYECRDAAKSLLGDRYKEHVDSCVMAIELTANTMGCSNIKAATTLAKKANREITAILYLAAVVEMTEHSSVK